MGTAQETDTSGLRHSTWGPQLASVLLQKFLFCHLLLRAKVDFWAARAGLGLVWDEQ